jgi:hypothetical protein
MTTLTQTERDLQKYTLDKIDTLIHDVAQSFEIAGVKGEALSCLGGALLRTAVLIALTTNVPRDKFMQWAADMFDGEQALIQKRKH